MSLSKLIHSLQSKKYHHYYHRQSSMHAFPFPPPCSESRRGCCSFLSSQMSHRWFCQHDGPAADCGTSMIPNLEVKAQKHQKFLGAGLARFSGGAGIPSAPLLCPDARLHIWADTDLDSDQSWMFWDSSSELGSASDLAGRSLGCKSWEISLKIAYFSKSLFFNSVFLPYTLEMLGKWFLVPRTAFSL